MKLQTLLATTSLLISIAAGLLLAQGTLEFPRPTLGGKTDERKGPQLGVPAATINPDAAGQSPDSAVASEDQPLLIDEFEESLVPDFSTQTLNVLVPVTVTDREGNFVNGLEPYEFQLLDNGVAQRISEDVAARPISLVVAVQTSSTTREILPTVQKVAPLFDSLVIGQTGEMALIGFDHRIQKHMNFTSDPDEIRNGFAKLKTGSTQGHLDDAAMEGILMLRNRPADRKRILLLIGETRDTGSRMTPRDVLTEAEFNDIVIYTVNMSHFMNQLTAKAQPNRPNPIPVEGRMPLPMGTIATGTTDSQTNVGNWAPIFGEIFQLVKGVFVPNPMEVYTTYTGGREYGFVTLGALEQAITDIGEEIHSQYLLSFSPSDQSGGYHEIEVRVLTSPELEIRTRPGYWIAGPAR